MSALIYTTHTHIKLDGISHKHFDRDEQVLAVKQTQRQTTMVTTVKVTIHRQTVLSSSWQFLKRGLGHSHSQRLSDSNREY